MAYVFTSTNGFLKITNIDFHFSTNGPISISYSTNYSGDNFLTISTRQDLSFKFKLSEIESIGGLPPLDTSELVINQIENLLSLTIT